MQAHYHNNITMWKEAKKYKKLERRKKGPKSKEEILVMYLQKIVESKQLAASVETPFFLFYSLFSFISLCTTHVYLKKSTLKPKPEKNTKNGAKGQL